MSETPFRIGQTTVGNPCVQNATGEILDVCINEEHARKSLGDALRVWHYANGPELTRQRDEAVVERDVWKADAVALLARATAAEARCKVLEEALTEIARGVLDNENGGDYIDKAYRLAHAALRDARKGKK